MKRFQTFYFLLFLFFPFLGKGQSNIHTDITTPYDDIFYLINNVLSDGTAVITNATYTFGSPAQIGYFYDSNQVNPVFGYGEGVFLSTRGPKPIELNDAGDATPLGAFNTPSTMQDPDLDLSLQQLFGTNYNPATHDQQNLIVVEFDIEAGLDYFEFWYSFASREYQSFTCSNFNDVFGFYVSGPDPNSTTPYNQKNIALIPTDTSQQTFTNIPVAINSLNAGLQPFDPDCIDANPNFVNDSIYFNSNSNSSPVNFHFTGYTDPLRAFIPAVCGQTYHMKLAICDVSDNILPSAVLLEKNSLRSPVNITFESGPNITPDTNGWFYEGCGTSIIKFKRPTVPDYVAGTGDLRVDFSLLGTAEYGSDKDFVFLNNPFTDHLIIPDTADEFILNIKVLNDNIVEGLENLILRVPHLAGIGCGSQDSGWVDFEIMIQDYPELNIDLVDEINIHCPGEEVILDATITGGIPLSDPLLDYNIHWSQIGYAPTQTVYPEKSTTYYIEVSDQCPENGIIDSVRVNVLQWPELKIDKLDDEFVCFDISQRYNILDGKLNGGDENYIYHWKNMEDNSWISGERDPSLFPGTYEVDIVDGCGNRDKEIVNIYHYEAPSVEIISNEVAGIRNIELSLIEFPLSVNFLGYMPVDFIWNFGDGSPEVHSNGKIIHQFPDYGFYTITVTVRNDRGCEKEFSKVIEVSPLITVPTIFSPNGDGVNEGFAPICSRKLESYEFAIFDRWGKELFRTTDLADKWYGKTEKGNICDEGIYVYKFKIKYPNYPDEEYHQGVFHLTR